MFGVKTMESKRHLIDSLKEIINHLEDIIGELEKKSELERYVELSDESGVFSERYSLEEIKKFRDFLRKTLEKAIEEYLELVKQDLLI